MVALLIGGGIILIALAKAVAAPKGSPPEEDIDECEFCGTEDDVEYVPMCKHCLEEMWDRV